MSRLHLLAAAVATAAVATTTAGPAVAAGAKLTLVGLGTYSVSAGVLSYDADLSGSPVSGHASGTLAAADGSLPPVGACEPGTASLRVEDPRGHHVDLVSSGEVCGTYLPLGEMQTFRGRWTVESTSLRKLQRTTGVLDLRFMNGQSDVYATS